MANKKNSQLLQLVECAIMLALSFVLSLFEVYKMPMGGGITILSMLPVMLISVKYGLKAGLTTSFLFSLTQLAQGYLSGNVFAWGETFGIDVVIILFDYIVPFTVLGLCGIAKKAGKRKIAPVVVAIFACIALRFVCHFITGWTVWGQWAPEGMAAPVYSLIYNGQYMLPEGIITSIGAGILLAIPQVRKLLDMAPVTEEAVAEVESADDINI